MLTQGRKRFDNTSALVDFQRKKSDQHVPIVFGRIAAMFGHESAVIEATGLSTKF